MRLLVVSQYFWPETFRINDVVRSLVERGVSVDVLCGKPNYPEGRLFPGYRAWGAHEENWSGAKLFRVPMCARGSRSAWHLALNYVSFVLSGSLFGPWLLRGNRYDVVFVHGLSPILVAIPAIIVSWLKGVRVVLWVQDLWPDSLAATGYVRNRAMLRVVERVVRWIYQQTDLILVQSRGFEAPVAALAPGKSIAYLPNSVDPMFSKFPVSESVVLQIEGLDDGFSVVFAGNVGAAQAVEVIVGAAELLQHHRDIHFVVVGNGSRWGWMCEQAETRNLENLHLPGRFPVETMPGLMQRAGALLVTLSDEPIFALTIPNKIQAYMAVGRPILASLNGEGARIVVEAGAGVGTPAGDARALADAVLKLYRMTGEERAQMGANGRRYFKSHFDHEKLMDELMMHLAAMSAEGDKWS